MQFAIIDIEATGGSPKRDKITEIAIYLYDEDGETVIDSFSTLINPEIEIPPFISKLTGITNAMVATAPTFSEVASKINAITKDAVFVAHNVQFDYAYVRAEFKRLGTKFKRPKLCTINLAKNIFPDMTSYGLGNMCKDLGITIANRHRAAGDAEATVQLFEMMLKKDVENHLNESISEHLAYDNLPSQLPSSILDQLPEETGVYYLHDINGEIIYLSRSNDIRRRIFQHFKGKNARYWNILSQTYDITYDETGSELIAQLLEIYHIRKTRPRFNRRSSLPRFPFGVFTKQGKNGFLELEARRKHGHERPEIVFEKEDEIGVWLLSKVKDYQLCPALSGLSVNNRKKCIVCQNTKSKEKGCLATTTEHQNYNQRVRKAMRKHQYPVNNFLVIGEGRNIEEQSIVCVENGKYLGYVYLDKNITYNLEMVKDGLNNGMSGMEVEKILISYLKKNKLDKVVEF